MEKQREGEREGGDGERAARTSLDKGRGRRDIQKEKRREKSIALAKIYVEKSRTGKEVGERERERN